MYAKSNKTFFVIRKVMVSAIIQLQINYQFQILRLILSNGPK